MKTNPNAGSFNSMLWILKALVVRGDTSAYKAIKDAVNTFYSNVDF
jgi:hypothetical protein